MASIGRKFLEQLKSKEFRTYLMRYVHFWKIIIFNYECFNNLVLTIRLGDLRFKWGKCLLFQ